MHIAFPFSQAHGMRLNNTLKFLVSLMLFCCIVPEAQALTSDVPRILVINSYNYGYDWSDGELAGLQESFEGRHREFQLFVEYLDTKRFHRKEHFPAMANLLEEKYASQEIDVLVAMDNAALEFASQYRNRLFLGVPLIFCGVNNFQPEMIEGQSQITGIAERHDPEGTLNLALKLLPKTHRVIVLHDYTDTGQAMRKELENIADHFPNIEFRFLEEAPIETTVSRLKKLSDGEIVLILTYSLEQGGRTFANWELAKLVSQNTQVPVFGLLAELLGHGVVGGMMLEGKDQGHRIAGVALRILAGTPATDIPVQLSNMSRPMFDYAVMRQFKIGAERLPSGAQIIHQPDTSNAVDKKAFWLLFGATLFIATSISIIFGNIRGRQKAEMDRKESEARFRLLVEQAPEAILIHDVDADRFIDCNPKAAKLFGCTSKEVMRHGPQQFYVPRQPDGKPIPESMHDNVERALAGEEVRFERTVLNGRNEKIYCEVTLVKFPSKESRLLRASYTDVTERKKMESQLIQADKMRAIGELSSGIAHDFNNQLSGILGHAELLLNRLEPGKLSDFAQNIKNSAQSAADLTRKLLSFSYKTEHLQVPVDIHTSLKETISVLKRSLDKRIRLVQHLDAIERTVLGDSSQLQNAFLNIAINARDAMPEGGELVIATEEVVLDTTSSRNFVQEPNPGRYLKISLSDTGCGMDKKLQSRIFEPFYTTKEAGQGTGLGLASVYGTVVGHKGHISVYSEVGQGTTFHLYLPLADQVEIADAAKDSAEPVKGSGTILFVDDEEMICQLAAEMLRSLGYQVVVCRSGAEGIRRYQEQAGEIDLAIIDMVMPGMDGHETIKALQKIDPMVKILLASGHSLNSRAQGIIADGVLAFISKPFNYLELSDKVAAALAPQQDSGTIPA